MMPVSRFAATAVVCAVAPAGVASAATAPAGTQGTTAARAKSTDGVGSSGDIYAMPKVNAEAEKNASRFYRVYKAPGGVMSLRLGVFPGGLAPAPGDPGTATNTAHATHGQASARGGVGAVGTWLRITLLLGLAVLLAAGAMATAFVAPARAALPAGFIGVTAEDVYAGTDAYQATSFTRQRAVGFTTIRQVFRWNEIQPTRDRFDFSATDRFVLAAARSGIRVMPVLFGEPAWATSRPAGNVARVTFAPKSPTDFAAFAAAIARRYGPGGSLWAENATVAAAPMLAYQLWNEPNLGIYWGGKPNPAAYAALLKPTSAALRTIQPAATIVSGGIPDSHLGMAPARFLKTFLKAGGGATINAVGVHPYSPKVTGVLKLTQRMRTTLNRYKGKKIGLWVTEIGWAAGGPKTPGRTVTAKVQASLIASMFKTLAKKRSALKLRGIVYFAWRDLPPYPGRTDFWGLRTGILDLAGKDKPAVASLTKTLKALR